MPEEPTTSSEALDQLSERMDDPDSAADGILDQQEKELDQYDFADEFPSESDHTPSEEEATPDMGEPQDAPPTDPEPEAEPQPALDGYLVEQARSHGFDPAAFRDEAALRTTVEAFNLRQHPPQPMGMPSMPQAAPPPPGPMTPQWAQQQQMPMAQPPQAVPQQAPNGAPQVPEYSEELDPELREALSQRDQRYQQEVSHLRNQVQTLVQQNTRSTIDGIVQRFEQRVEGLGPEWKEVFGEGPTTKLPGNSLEVQNRAILASKMDALAGSYAQRPYVPQPSEEQLFQEALRAGYGDRVQELARKQVASTLQKRSGQIIHKPTHRNRARPEDPEQRARAYAKNWVKDHGLLDEAEI